MNASNRFGELLIAMARRRGDVDVVHFLIHEANVSLDILDDFGRTPLHDACWTSHLPNIQVMDELLRVCPPDMLLAEDIRGHTPFHYARKEHWEQWEDFLRTQSLLLLNRLVAASTTTATTTNTVLDHADDIHT